MRQLDDLIFTACFWHIHLVHIKEEGDALCQNQPHPLGCAGARNKAVRNKAAKRAQPHAWSSSEARIREAKGRPQLVLTMQHLGASRLCKRVKSLTQPSTTGFFLPCGVMENAETPHRGPPVGEGEM